MHFNENHKKPLYTEIEITVQPYEIDFAGIVSNTVYVNWLEQARFKLLDIYHPLNEQMAEGFAPVLLETNVKYIKSIRLFDPVIIQMWIGHIRKLRWRVDAEIYVNKTLYTKASQIGIFASIKEQKPVLIPEKLKNIYEKQQIYL